jgi:hypothetical protein
MAATSRAALLACVAAAAASAAAAPTPLPPLQPPAVTWTQPTPDSPSAGTYADGMPIGNGDLTALGWANVTSGGFRA